MQSVVCLDQGRSAEIIPFPYVFFAPPFVDVRDAEQGYVTTRGFDAGATNGAAR